jgi:hypothetical protein
MVDQNHKWLMFWSAIFYSVIITLGDEGPNTTQPKHALNTPLVFENLATIDVETGLKL